MGRFGGLGSEAMISVVMATYNGEQFIAEQLESILGQSRKPDEIIINDDGSIDGTIEIIKKFKAKNDVLIDLQINEERLGYAANFRNAIGRSRGDIVFLSDQDDVWTQDKIEISISYFKKYSEILALSTGYSVIDSKSKRIRGLDFSFMATRKLKKISWKQFIRHPKYPGMAMAFRKSIWLQIDNLNWRDGVAHDWMINQYAAVLNGMYKIKNKLVLYRQHSGNTVGLTLSKQKKDLCYSRFKLICELTDELEWLKLQELETEKRGFVEKLLKFQRSRAELVRDGQLLRLLFYEIVNKSCISYRAMLGDLYSCIKGENRRDV